MLDIESLVNDFFSYLKYKEDIEIYNEFSFQHELGIFLREKLNENNKDYKIQFERNVKDFGYIPKDKNEKKEIDIVILNKYENDEKYAIELKFANATNGQYPEKMFSFIKDIHFMETVKAECKGFVRNYCITIVEDENFYKKKGKIDGIYAYFRNGKQITGDIEKPTGKEKYSISLKETYQIIWQKFGENKKFYIVKIS
ncbi:hypothetical protein B0183_04815 [Glaesserella parasuis]|uniref:hypothetical protein n=1 Tax=Glaesserella parasuis TaxID=738 RepID=UPI0009940680|nr:hypothetical protein [Glaesserella parasuis]OOR92634.1 hypothetical protein B0183_04815 [Glaesserella parasuis]STO79696.1 Uncharacterised protein [Glaesserella parasuis]